MLSKVTAAMVSLSGQHHPGASARHADPHCKGRGRRALECAPAPERITHLGGSNATCIARSPSGGAIDRKECPNHREYKSNRKECPNHREYKSSGLYPEFIRP